MPSTRISLLRVRPRPSPSTLTVQFGGDSLYSTGTAAQQVVVYGMPDGGQFVVGDRSATGAVTFWSPSWWRLNTLSTGPAPANFQGFATATPAGGWIASPGMGGAPETVPAWMAVLVARHIENHRSLITVTTNGMVVVHVDTYDPQLIGRGTVVATID